MDKLLPCDMDVYKTDENGDMAIMSAARCENWEVVSHLMSKQVVLPDKDHVIAFLRILGRSEYMKKNCGLSANILCFLWDNLKQMIPECHHEAIHNILILVAAKVNCWWLVRDLLTADIELNTLDEDGMGLVHRLAKGQTNKHISLLLRVLENGGDINLKNVNGDTAAHIAVKSNNWEMISDLLDKGASIDIVNKKNRTVLHLLALCSPSNIALSKNIHVIFKLAQKRILNIDTRDITGNTALQLAVKERNNLVAEKLLTFGARSDLLDENGRTLLHSLVMNQNAVYLSSLLMKAIKSGSSLATKDSEGNTAVHVAAKLNKWECVNYLLAHGASATEPDSEGWTVIDRVLTREISPNWLCNTSIFKEFSLCQQLHLAVSLRRLNFLEELVKKGVNVNSPDHLGFTVLQKHVQLGSNIDSVFRFLVKSGADVTVRTPAGDNLLQLAAKHQNWSVVKWLLDQNFSAYEPDSEGFCVFQRLAEDRGKDYQAHFRLFKKDTVTLLQAPNGDTLLQLATKHKNLPMVEYLVQQGAVGNINQLDSEGLSVLHRIVQYKSEFAENHQVCIVKLLLTKGAKPCLCNSEGDTALHLAAKHDNWIIVKNLLKKGCDINQPDSEGFYILHRLAQRQDSLRYGKKSKPIFQMLFDKGADLSVRSKSGDTVLHMAAKHGNWVVVSHLIDEGADINELDSEGFHILQRPAKEPEDIEIILAKDLDLDLSCPNIGMALNLGVKEQKWNFAKRLVELGADVNKLDFNVLHVIATQKIDDGRDDCTALINLLLIKGADVTARSPKGDSVFHLAARHDNWEIIEQILAQRTDGLEHVDEPDSEGFTILHRLAKSNRGERFIRVLQFLLDNGAKCDKPSPTGDSVLHLAVKNNWYVIEELLSCKTKSQSDLAAQTKPLETEHNNQTVKQDVKESERRQGSKTLNKQIKGDRGKNTSVAFNINAKDAHGNTILHLSIKAKKWSRVYTLLICGADVSLPDNEGHTAFYWMAAVESEMINHPSMCSVLEILRERVPGTMEKDEFGETLIQVAARNKNVEVVGLLLDHLDDVNMRDLDELTILHRAVQWVSPASLKIVKSLIKRKSDIEIPDPKGDTALHLAAQCGNWDAVRELLENGAQADKADKKGWCVLHRLLKHQSTSKPISSSHLLNPCQNTLRNISERKLHLVKLMVSNGAKIYKRYNNGLTATQLAVSGREWEVLQFFLESEDKNFKKKKWIFHELAMDTRVNAQTAGSITQQLLTCGYNLNECEKQGDTPLNLAANYSNWTVVSVFLNHGADASIPDTQGWFVCHRLAMDNRATRFSTERLSSILLLLKNNGFEVNQRGPDGKSCVQLTIERKKWSLLWCLVECGVECFFTFSEKKKIFKYLFRIARGNVDEQILRSFILRLMEKDDDSCQTLTKTEQVSLKISVFNSNWVVAKVLLECGVNIRVNNDRTLTMHSLISQYRHCDHMTWLSFLDALLARGANINSQDKDGKTILFQVCAQYGQDDLDLVIHALLNRGANPLLADSTGKSLLRCTLDLKKGLDLKVLVFIIQLGVSTHQPTLTETAKSLHDIRSLEASPTRKAVEKENVRALEMLVESGASSYREIFELSTQYQVQLSSREVTEAETQMLDILNHAASQPRSLKSWCRLTVSHALGCGPRRIERIKSLPLLDTIQDYILFSDLLSL